MPFFSFLSLTFFLHLKQIKDEWVWISSMCPRWISGPILISLFFIFSISITSIDMISILLLTSIIWCNFPKTVYFAEYQTVLFISDIKCIYFEVFNILSFIYKTPMTMEKKHRGFWPSSLKMYIIYLFDISTSSLYSWWQKLWQVPEYPRTFYQIPPGEQVGQHWISFYMIVVLDINFQGCSILGT